MADQVMTDMQLALTMLPYIKDAAANNKTVCDITCTPHALEFAKRFGDNVIVNKSADAKWSCSSNNLLNITIAPGTTMKTLDLSLTIAAHLTLVYSWASKAANTKSVTYNLVQSAGMAGPFAIFTSPTHKTKLLASHVKMLRKYSEVLKILYPALLKENNIVDIQYCEKAGVQVPVTVAEFDLNYLDITIDT